MSWIISDYGRSRELHDFLRSFSFFLYRSLFFLFLMSFYSSVASHNTRCVCVSTSECLLYSIEVCAFFSAWPTEVFDLRVWVVVFGCLLRHSWLVRPLYLFAYRTHQCKDSNNFPSSLGDVLHSEFMIRTFSKVSYSFPLKPMPKPLVFSSFSGHLCGYLSLTVSVFSNYEMFKTKISFFCARVHTAHTQSDIDISQLCYMRSYERGI